MNVMEQGQPHIFILGAGIDTPSHLSIETMDILATCNEIWANIPEVVQQRLPSNLSPTVRSLKSFFLPDRPRIDNYNAIISHLLERVGTCGRIGYLTQGHPLVFDTVAARLIIEGNDRGFVVAVKPAISSIDTVLVNVLYDPAKGLQIHEATAFVRKKITVDVRAALLLLQPAVFGTKMPRLTSVAPGPDLSPLSTALQAFYPEEHPVRFVRSATATMEASVFDSTVGSMSLVPSSATLASSIFIPPVVR